MSVAVAGSSMDGRRDADGESAGQGIIKQEKDSDIKDYAETTMNELLGWYGYDKLDSRGLNLKTLGRHFPNTSSSSSSPIRPDDPASSEDDTVQSGSPITEGESVQCNASSGTTIICAWCLKMGLKLFTLKTASGETKEFCSEPCFNQCRRAAFKKNRICNWCRHVRHTVNYVDFQDGDDQLQFCSDKCLNQYKMQIFCKETQAYLQMNPHLQEESKNAASSKLITPDLWLRDCQETINGGMSNSGDEMPSRLSDKEELEDLSLHPKPETDANPTHAQRPDIDSKNIPFPVKDFLAERRDSIPSYISDEKEKSERRKRHFDLRENSRKRQRMSSFKNKTSHHAEAPPAHLSSSHPSANFQNQSPIFPSPSSLAMPLRNKSPVINPPVAHTKSFSHHPGITKSMISQSLPPPPPLLNNDFYHSPFNPPMFPSQQQQLDAMLRMQTSFPPSTPFPPNLYPESVLPFYRKPTPHNANPLTHSNAMMLPYPIFVPLPVPIPIPLPLTSFLPKNFKKAEKEAKDNRISNIKETNIKSSETIDLEMKESSMNKTEGEPSGGKNDVVRNDRDVHKFLKKAKNR